VAQVWKQKLDLGGVTVTTVTHAGPAPLHVGPDGTGVPCIWFWAPSTEDGLVGVRDTEIELVGTGIPVDASLVGALHIGSFVWRGLVLHAFARPQ
jgi:hypothetical protein